MRPSRPIRSEAAGEVERLQRELRRVTMERDIGIMGKLPPSERGVQLARCLTAKAWFSAPTEQPSKSIFQQLPL